MDLGLHFSTIETGVNLHERRMLTFAVLNKQCAPRDKNQNYTQFLNVMYACT